MCTLIIGVDAVGPGTLVAGANRDEDPARPSDPPRVLIRSPRVIGGRDRRAGGTWLALREGRMMVAMLNRRDARPAAPAVRSRGLLALETAAAPEPGSGAPGDLVTAALERALEGLRRDAYAAFSMVIASPGSSRLLVHEPGRSPQVTSIPAGWHVLTHTELDDPGEPRAARLVAELAGWKPQSMDQALRGLADRLREHGEGADAVCVHSGRMVTVSSSRIGLDRHEARYFHVEGRPCEAAETELTPLLAGTPLAGETS